jgi:hypothetical protein
MTATKQMTRVMAVLGEQPAPFGGIEARYQLNVYENESGDLVVDLIKDGGEVVRKRFIYCETQHSDSERWLNDQVGFPNPFAGILLMRGWES